MNLKELREAARKKAQALMDAAKAEERALTDEELTQIEKHLSEVERYDRMIEAETKLVPLKPSTDNQQGDDDVIALTGLPRSSGRITIHDNRQDEPWPSFGHFLLAVRSASDPELRHSPDPRLFRPAEELRAVTGLSEGVSSEGGFLVQQDYSTALLNRANETSVLLDRCRRLPLSPSSNGAKLPYVDETSRATGSRWGGVRAYWADEGEEKTASKPKFGRLELNLRKLVGLCYATDEVLSDATLLGSFIDQAFAEEFAFQIDDAIINGTGAGQPLGIMQSGSLVTVAKETSQAAATIIYQNINKMYSRNWSRGRSSGIWLINQDCEPQLEVMTVDVKNVAGSENVGGAPVYVPPGGAAARPYGTLKGLPVLPIEQCQTVGTTGDIILAQLNQYLVIRRDMEAASSIHVRFIFDESVFRFVYRIDGQPAWKSQLTPFKGSNTISPFVCLATRS